MVLRLECGGLNGSGWEGRRRCGAAERGEPFLLARGLASPLRFQLLCQLLSALPPSSPPRLLERAFFGCRLQLSVVRTVVGCTPPPRNDDDLWEAGHGGPHRGA